jgi:hypothetical protein
LPIQLPTKFELALNLKTARHRHRYPADHPGARRTGDRMSGWPVEKPVDRLWKTCG